MSYLKKHKSFVAALVAFAFVGALLAASAQYVTNLDKLQLDQNAILDSSGTNRIFTGSRLIFNGPLAHGDSSTTASITLPTSTTGANFAHQLPVYNPTASTIAAGSVLIASDTGAGYVNVCPATIDLTSIVGVAAASIGATSRGFMVPRGGGYAVVLTTGTISVGDALISTGTVVGYAGKDTTPTTGADFGVAMTASSGAGASSVLAILH